MPTTPTVTSPMKRAFYSDSISTFLAKSPESILDTLASQASQTGFPPLQSQLYAWRLEIQLLKQSLSNRTGGIYFEYSIPRMGRRIDVVLLIGPVIFVIEFKIGESKYNADAYDQVWDYALDLKNFHTTSHNCSIVPLLIPTEAPGHPVELKDTHGDGLYEPVRTAPGALSQVLERVLAHVQGQDIGPLAWESGRYQPTPTIIEAARVLYTSHSVVDISRSEAAGENLKRTSDALHEIIKSSVERSQKTICFVTGVPGAGKTLVGLKVATEFMDPKNKLHAVYLSGNGPLVKVLCEALARDKKERERALGKKYRIGRARTDAKAFIQNVHHFRDECLQDIQPPDEHVTLFDEAQRAWDLKQTSQFMRQKKGRPDFNESEPEFLVSCLDRHPDWAVIICLVGGGQEINQGEAGIGEWVRALNRRFPKWQIYVSRNMTGSEYGSTVLEELGTRQEVHFRDELHLATSMRSFRAENVSQLVKDVLELNLESAQESLKKATRYPIKLTRNLQEAKRWVRQQARGSERFGLLVSSQAERLRPYAINVRSPVNPVHWFLEGKDDVRSSYYLEDVATEFHVQGLELDWACVTWDADLRHTPQGWQHWSFKGKRWTRIKTAERRRYLTNAYRVLLTRARQGMVIVVPEGDRDDPTRDPSYYDPTYRYLKKVGFETL